MMCFYLRSMWTSVALLFLLVLLLHFPLSLILFPVSLLSPFVDSSSKTDREYLSQRGLCSLIMKTKQFLHLYLPPTVPYLFFDTDYLGVMNTQKQMHMISFGCLTHLIHSLTNNTTKLTWKLYSPLWILDFLNIYLI